MMIPLFNTSHIGKGREEEEEEEERDRDRKRKTETHRELIFKGIILHNCGSDKVKIHRPVGWSGHSDKS